MSKKVKIILSVIVLGLYLSLTSMEFNLKAAPLNDPLTTVYVDRMAIDLPQSLTVGEWDYQLWWDRDEFSIFMEEQLFTDPESGDEEFERLGRPKDSPEGNAEITYEDLNDFFMQPAKLCLKTYQSSSFSLELFIKQPQGYLRFSASEYQNSPESGQKKVTESDFKNLFLEKIKIFLPRYQWLGQNEAPSPLFMAGRYGRISLAEGESEPEFSIRTKFKSQNRPFYAVYVSTFFWGGEPQLTSEEEQGFYVAEALAKGSWCRWDYRPMALAGHSGFEYRQVISKKGGKDPAELWLRWEDATEARPADDQGRWLLEIASDDDLSTYDEFPAILGVWEAILPTVRLSTQ